MDMEPEVIYEAHPTGTFINCLEILPEHRNKITAFMQPYAIKHLKKLGVTTVQLMPIFDSEGTYWGYDPISWFDINPAYGNIQDLKKTVSILQKNGLKVVLDVVYNHVHNDYIQQFKDNGVHFYDWDVTGCGNTVNVRESLPVIMDSINYWLREIGCDGMRFDLAGVLGREGGNFNPNAKFFHELSAYKDKLLIAEPYDIAEFSLGRFPDYMRELNTRARDHIRQGSTYWCDDLDWERSINFVTCHDGFTLEDLVSYNSKHNEANGENNRDGCDNNISWNHGVEGPTTNEAVLLARKLKKQKLLADLRVSSHSILLRAGDELGNTQWGNNNAYKYGNHTSYVNW